MVDIKLTIPGEPKTQQRHRTTLIVPDRKKIEEADAAAQRATYLEQSLSAIARGDTYDEKEWLSALMNAYDVCKDAIYIRAAARKGFQSQYDPSKQEKAEILAAVWDQRPDVPLDEPLRVDITWYYKRPGNHYRTGKYAGQLKPTAPLWCTKAPDRDNADKIYLDALNKVFWRDDSIACVGLPQKKWSIDPRTEIHITNLT